MPQEWEQQRGDKIPFFPTLSPKLSFLRSLRITGILSGNSEGRRFLSQMAQEEQRNVGSEPGGIWEEFLSPFAN